MQTFFQSILTRYYQPLLAVALVLIIGFSFYTGFWEGKRATDQSVTLSCNQNILSKLSIPLETLADAGTADAAATRQGGAYIGSKNGTKYYPSLTCSAVKRIKPENYLWFISAEDAQIQGYAPGKC